MSERAGIRVGKSPFGADDEVGALNLLSPARRESALARADPTRMYDLSVDYFVGMPSFQAAGDPGYQIFMSHTPGGTEIDNLNGAGDEVNRHVCYSGDVVFMYTHTGTHIDAFCHFGIDGKTFNDVDVASHLGSRGWTRGGAERIPPIVGRGVLIDVAKLKNMPCLPDSYAISPDDCAAALEAAGLSLEEGDVVLVRTGRMREWPRADKVLGNPPGLSLAAARWLTGKGISVIGADQECVEVGPSLHEDNWLPGHCHFLAEAGVPMIELLDLEALSADGVKEFTFIGAPIRLRGATGAPIRPVAFPFRA